MAPQSIPNEPAKPSMQLDAADDDEPDDWDKRITDTGCSAENEKLRFCFVDKKDWRLCKSEMDAFKKCWAEHGNIARTSSKDL